MTTSVFMRKISNVICQTVFRVACFDAVFFLVKIPIEKRGRRVFAIKVMFDTNRLHVAHAEKHTLGTLRIAYWTIIK